MERLKDSLEGETRGNGINCNKVNDVWHSVVNYSHIILHITEPLNGSQSFLEVGRIYLSHNEKNLYSAGEPTQIILVRGRAKLEALMREEVSKRH